MTNVVRARVASTIPPIAYERESRESACCGLYKQYLAIMRAFRKPPHSHLISSHLISSLSPFDSLARSLS
jgi:hypothetical protein